MTAAIAIGAAVDLGSTSVHLLVGGRHGRARARPAPRRVGVPGSGRRRRRRRAVRRGRASDARRHPARLCGDGPAMGADGDHVHRHRALSSRRRRRTSRRRDRGRDRYRRPRPHPRGGGVPDAHRRHGWSARSPSRRSSSTSAVAARSSATCRPRGRPRRGRPAGGEPAHHPPRDPRPADGEETQAMVADAQRGSRCPAAGAPARARARRRHGVEPAQGGTGRPRRSASGSRATRRRRPTAPRRTHDGARGAIPRQARPRPHPAGRCGDRRGDPAALRAGRGDRRRARDPRGGRPDRGPHEPATGATD